MEDLPRRIEHLLLYRQLEVAEALCEGALEESPSIALLLGRVYLEQGNPGQTLALYTHYEEHLALMPTFHYFKAVAYFELGDYIKAEEALKYFTHCKESPELPKELLEAAKLLENKIICRTRRLLDNTKIREQFQYSWPGLEAAVKLFKRALYRQAATEFEDFYEKHLFVTKGTDIFSTVLWQLNDAMRLRCLVERLVKLAPGSAVTWIATGNLYSLQKQSDEAIRMFDRAANIDRSCSYALTLKGHEHLFADHLDAAQESFREAISRSSDEWSAWYGLGATLFRTEKYSSAIYYIKRSVALNPESPVLRHILAFAYRQNGQNEEAMEMLKEALELDSNNIVAIQQQAELLFEQDRLDETARLLERADGVVSGEPGISFLRGMVASRIGDFEESLRWFSEAIALGFEDTEAIRAEMRGVSAEILSSLFEK